MNSMLMFILVRLGNTLKIYIYILNPIENLFNQLKDNVKRFIAEQDIARDNVFVPRHSKYGRFVVIFLSTTFVFDPRGI